MDRQLRRRGPAIRQPGAVILLLVLAVALGGCEGDSVWVPDWQPTAAMQVPRAGAAAAAHDGFLYMIGGVDGKVFLRSTEYAPVRADGSLGPWRSTEPLPAPRGFAAAVVHDGYVYVIGGANGRHGEQLFASMLRAPIGEDGALGPWQAEPEGMKLPRRCAKVAKAGDRLYALGGFAGTLLDSVERTVLGADGHAGPWRMQSTTLTMPRYVDGVKRVGDRIVVLGGHHPRRGSGLRAVESARLGDGDLHWTRGADLQQGRYALATAAHEGRLYALGGISGSEYLDSVETTEIGDGPMEWRRTTRLREPLASFSALTSGGRIYILGGTAGGQYRRSVWWAGFNDAGDIGFRGTAEQAEAAAERRHRRQQPAAQLPNRGVVVSTIDSGGYTYIQVRQDQQLQWLAAPTVKLKVGDTIRFSRGVAMPGFYSQSLDREFKRILFVGTVEMVKEPIR